MKSKKIISALSALVMGATMMAGTAMSASAFCIKDGNGNCVEDVQFYAYYDADHDGTPEWAPAPNGMDDGNIADAVDNGDGTVTIELGTMPYNFGGTTIYGDITGVTESGIPVDISSGYWTPVIGNVYTISITLSSGMHLDYNVKVIVTPCNCGGNCQC